MREVGRAEHATTEQLSAMLDGRAEPDEQQFLAGHVGGCVVCSNELADLRTVSTMLRSLPLHLPPRSFTIPLAAAAPQPRRYGRLVPFTRILGTVAAVLCVVFFSVDAMQTGYDPPLSVPDGSTGAMHLTTRATIDAERAGSRPVTAASESSRPAAAAQPAEAAPKVAEAPPAAAKPAATPAPIGFGPQSIANTLTATPAAPAPAVAAGRAADASAPQAGQAASSGVAAAPAPPPGQPAAARSQPADAAKPADAANPARAAQSAGAAPQPAAAATVTGFAPSQPVGAPGQQANPPAPSVSATMAARQDTAARQDASAEGFAPVTAPTAAVSPWLTPLRLWSLASALLAATLLILSLVLSRLSRRQPGPTDEWSRS